MPSQADLIQSSPLYCEVMPCRLVFPMKDTYHHYIHKISPSIQIHTSPHQATTTTTTMSEPNRVTHTRNGHSSNGFSRLANGEQFAEFFEFFLSEQSRNLASLRAAASASPRPSDADLRQLVDRVVSHYEYYYRAKSASAQNDVNTMFSPCWTSSTENLFMWVGGWRPSTAFHLLYSKSGLQLEAKLEEIIRGIRTGDLGDLSPNQLESVDKLQRKTIKMEREISEEEAKVQEELAAVRMVEIVGQTGEGELEGEMERKRKGMLSVLERADKLRIETMKGIMEVLEPIQAVHFLIAAAELHLAVHEFGRRKDAVTNGNGGMET